MANSVALAVPTTDEAMGIMEAAMVSVFSRPYLLELIVKAGSDLDKKLEKEAIEPAQPETFLFSEMDSPLLERLGVSEDFMAQIRAHFVMAKSAPAIS